MQLRRNWRPRQGALKRQLHHRGRDLIAGRRFVIAELHRALRRTALAEVDDRTQRLFALAALSGVVVDLHAAQVQLAEIQYRRSRIQPVA